MSAATKATLETVLKMKDGETSAQYGKRVAEAKKAKAEKTAAKKTAAKAKVEKAAAKERQPKAEGPRVIKAGGAKGAAVIEALKPGLSRVQVAEAAGCTVGRVGEVIRYLADNGTAEQKATIKAFIDGAPKRVSTKTEVKAETKKAPAKRTSKKAAAA